MKPINYVFIGIVVIVVAVFGIISIRRNNKIKKNGIETFATISRIEEHVSSGSDGDINYTYEYYCQYETLDGVVEAIISNVWQRNYKMGEVIKIKYLAQEPHRGIEVKK